jgi:hypothetical protein
MMAALAERLRKLERAARSRAATQALRPFDAPGLWAPFPGPQARAYHCAADELFYGGAAGAGKTDLELGLALTRHRHSIIYRREYPQLKGIILRSRELIGARGTFNGQAGMWRLDDGRLIELGAVGYDQSVQKFQGRPHDLIGFDELPQFTRYQYRFLIGWNRTSLPGQRCRVVAAGNPPTTPEGRWVVEEFAPWLDPEFPDPAEPGELRWYAVLDGELRWLRSGQPFEHEAKDGKRERVQPRSRTFIPGRVDDNPVLLASGYKSVLQGMPEPLRSQMLYGDFQAGTRDDAWQVIPTAWVRLAQKRWQEMAERGEDPGPLSRLGVDVAYGGADQTAIAPRHGRWFGRVKTYQGADTDSGPKAAALVLREHDGQASIGVDATSWGASCYESLKGAVGPLAEPINPAAATEETDRTRKFKLVNLRAAMYWKLREALDPEKGENLALPPDPELVADLCAPRFEVRASGIIVEPKKDLAARIGRSPDKGDAVAMSHYRPVKWTYNPWLGVSGDPPDPKAEAERAWEEELARRNENRERIWRDEW